MLPVSICLAEHDQSEFDLTIPQKRTKKKKNIYIDPRIAFRICFQFFIPFVIDFESVSREMTLRVGHINEVLLTRWFKQ